MENLVFIVLGHSVTLTPPDDLNIGEVDALEFIRLYKKEFNLPCDASFISMFRLDAMQAGQMSEDDEFRVLYGLLAINIVYQTTDLDELAIELGAAPSGFLH